MRVIGVKFTIDHTVRDSCSLREIQLPEKYKRSYEVLSEGPSLH